MILLAASHDDNYAYVRSADSFLRSCRENGDTYEVKQIRRDAGDEQIAQEVDAWSRRGRAVWLLVLIEKRSDTVTHTVNLPELTATLNEAAGNMVLGRTASEVVENPFGVDTIRIQLIGEDVEVFKAAVLSLLTNHI